MKDAVKIGDTMNVQRVPIVYETPLANEILHAYINKNMSYKRSDIRKIKRALRKLTFSRM